MKIEKIDIRKPMVILFMTALLVFAFWKIRLGVHSDEVYLIALGDMIAKGDSFFKECWSSLQMSAVFTAPFIFVYEKITGGREGILLFFRGVAVCVQLGICIYFYRTFSEKYQKMYVLIASILLFTFIPDFQSFTYKQELLWFATLEIVYSYKYYLTYKRKYLVLLSIMIAGSVLAYPTAILQFPVYFCLIYWIHHIKQGRKNLYSHVYIMTITCLVCMTVFMGVVLSRISIFEFIEYFPKVFSDNNLEMSFLSKLLHPLLKFGIMGIVTIVSIAWCEKIKKIPIPVMTCLLCGALLGQMYIERSGVTWHCITYSYALTLFMMPLIYVLNEKNEKNRVLILLFEIPAVTVIFCIALASNQGNITSMYGTVFSAAGLLLMLSDNEKLKGGGYREKHLIATSLCAGALSMYLIPVAEQEAVMPGHTARTIFTDRFLASNGPAKGIYLGDATYDQYIKMCEVVAENISSEDRVFMIDDAYTTPYGYLASEGEYATYSPQGGWGLAESDQAVEYFTDNSKKQPTVVIIRLEYIACDLHEYLEETPVGNYLRNNSFYLTCASESYVVMRQENNQPCN